MAAQARREWSFRDLEYKLLRSEHGFALEQLVNEAAKEDWRVVIGSFAGTTFGLFIWMERFKDGAQD